MAVVLHIDASFWLFFKPSICICLNTYYFIMNYFPFVSPLYCISGNMYLGNILYMIYMFYECHFRTTKEIIKYLF